MRSITVSKSQMKRSKQPVKMAHRYLTSRHLPDSAIDLLDEAAATVQNKAKHVKVDDSGLSPADKALMDGKWKQAAQLIAKEEQVPVYKDLVTESDILTTLSRLSGIPVQKLTQTDAKKYLNLEAELHKRVIGQDQAVSSISRAIRRNQSGDSQSQASDWFFYVPRTHRCREDRIGQGFGRSSL